MNLEQKIMAEMKTAMLNKEEGKLRAIRAIKAAIINAKTEKGATGELNEEQEIKLLQKLVKSRRDSMEIFQKENRMDLHSKEVEEVTVIEKFLPEQMSAEELRSTIQKIIIETRATSPADIGKVMGVASKQLAGKIDGKSISTMAKELLATQ